MLAKDMKSGTVVVNNDVPVIIESVMVQSPSAAELRRCTSSRRGI